VTTQTKWPRLLVLGEPVAPERAEEIILRTTNWEYLLTYGLNDRAWQTLVTGVMQSYVGLPSPLRLEEGEERYRSWARRAGVLDLTYLGNERVGSAFLGGPHGWIDWDGKIQTFDYNIGKWPWDAEITAEWRMIAYAFPDLRLRAQLVEDEGAGRPSAEWLIERGRIVLYDPEPARLIAQPQDLDVERMVTSLLSPSPGRERGIMIERLTDALVRWRQRIDLSEE